MNMKNLFAILAFLSATAGAHADYNSSVNCTPQYCYEAPCYPNSYNPPAYLRYKPCNDFFDSLSARIDFLWWRANETNLELGSEEFLSFSPTGSDTVEINREKRPKFKYDPGFRLGLNSVCPDGCWDIALDWTHYTTKAYVRGTGVIPTSATPSFTQFFSYWDLNPIANPLNYSKGRWSLNMDVVDLVIAHRFYMSNCLVLRPYVGLRGGRVDQGYRIFSSFEIITPNVSIQYTSDLHARCDFLGVGPLIGLEMFFELCNGFSLLDKLPALSCLARLTAISKNTLTLSMTLRAITFLLSIQKTSAFLKRRIAARASRRTWL